MRTEKEWIVKGTNENLKERGNDSNVCQVSGDMTTEDTAYPHGQGNRPMGKERHRQDGHPLA